MRVGFALEYSLGHATHAENLKRALRRVGGEAVADVDGVGDGARRLPTIPVYVDLPFQNTPVGRWAKLPPVRANWSVRASLGAYLGLRPHVAAGRLDALLFHTQVTSLFSTGLMRRVPAVVSLDATPLQIDALGAYYGHGAGGGRAEAFKKRMNTRAFRAARALVTWSAWAKASLVADYGVPAEKVTVIPPGVNTDLWTAAIDAARATADAEPGIVELLFVGADFARKGGHDLLEAWRRLPEAMRRQARLHIVTRSTPEQLRVHHEDYAEGVQFHNGLQPNSAGLIRRFARAGAFIFPTRADCLPLAVLEAMAAGLPVVTTAVGALPEAVRDGETGLVVPAADTAALAEAMRRLIGETALRRDLGVAAREAARARYDAGTNALRLLDVLERVGAGDAAARRPASPGWQPQRPRRRPAEGMAR